MESKRDRFARWLGGQGIEIGALHRPLAVPAGAKVTYVDHLPVERLREHYPELAELPLTQVDVIGTAEDLSAFADASLDFVIANHLLEHLEYPVRGLREFQRVLKPDGILFLALPDKRQTFDRGRQLTSIEHIFEEERGSKAAANRAAHYLDYAEKVDRKKRGKEAKAHAQDLVRRGYSIHFHVWRPDTFLELFFAARREFDLDLDLLALAGAEHEADDEFLMLFAKGRDGGVRLPRSPAPEPGPAPAQAPTLRARLARSPLGPPYRAAKRALRRARD